MSPSRRRSRGYYPKSQEDAIASHSNSSPFLDYKSAGVDIDAGNALVEAIKPLAQSTMRSGVIAGLGGFGACFDLKAAGFRDPLLVSCNDGVGTKLKIAIEANTHHTVGIDLVAMCVNDLVVQGAEPLFFLDYYATGRLNPEIGRDIIAGIAQACRDCGCALIGGETAEMPGLYADQDYDLAGFCVGAVERDTVLTGDDVRAGDLLLGLASSGLHSNGYSLVRKVIEQSGLSYSDPAPFNDNDNSSFENLGEALLIPTRLYVKSCLATLRTFGPKDQGIKALAHITGGGFIENLPRVLPTGIGVTLDATSWQVPPVFKFLAREGNIAPTEMMRTFNCGIGMVVVVGPDKAQAIADSFESEGERVFHLGRVEDRDTDQAIVQINGLNQRWSL